MYDKFQKFFLYFLKKIEKKLLHLTFYQRLFSLVVSLIRIIIKVLVAKYSMQESGQCTASLQVLCFGGVYDKKHILNYSRAIMLVNNF